jgi:hypothetical protein
MANISTFKETHTFTIAPDGTDYFPIGPNDAFANGTISVTAMPRTGTPGKALYLEVVQLATRTTPQFGGPPQHFIDIVVRNNSHAADPANASTINSFDVFVSVVSP